MGMRKIWYAPQNVGNGVLWLVGFAMQIGGWVNQQVAIGLLIGAGVWTAVSLIRWRRKTKTEQPTAITVEKLLKVGIFVGHPVNITRILYALREKLAIGLSDEVASEQDKLVLSQLNLRNIVQLKQRKVKVYGSDNVRDEGYWVLTELGKEVIKYLQANKQVLDKEGSLSE